VATNWSETSTGNAKRTRGGLGGRQPVNVNTLTLMLLYSVQGQSDRVVSVASLTSFFFFACVFSIYFILSIVAKEQHFYGILLSLLLLMLLF